MRWLVCALAGHDLPRDGTISQQCRRCGRWWHYDGQREVRTR